MRLCRKHPFKRILVCAPSDAAADVLCLRLKQYFTPRQLFRLNWWQRVAASMPVTLRPYSYSNKQDLFELPQINILQSYQIIVSTCATAGVLRALIEQQQQQQREHYAHQNHWLGFDVVMVDEASQAVEAEVSKIVG